MGRNRSPERAFNSNLNIVKNQNDRRSNSLGSQISNRNKLLTFDNIVHSTSNSTPNEDSGDSRMSVTEENLNDNCGRS